MTPFTEHIPAEAMIYTVSVTKPYPQLGLLPGDILVIEPGAMQPMVVYRPVATNYGAVLNMLADGGGVPLTPDLSVAELAAVVGQSALYQPASPLPSRARASGGHPRPVLRLEK